MKTVKTLGKLFLFGYLMTQAVEVRCSVELFFGFLAGTVGYALFSLQRTEIEKIEDLSNQARNNKSFDSKKCFKMAGEAKRFAEKTVNEDEKSRVNDCSKNFKQIGLEKLPLELVVLRAEMNEAIFEYKNKILRKKEE